MSAAGSCVTRRKFTRGGPLLARKNSGCGARPRSFATAWLRSLKYSAMMVHQRCSEPGEPST
jgi:hypothetical protein